MIPAWTLCIPLGLLLACTVLALETRPRALWPIAGLCALGAAILLLLGVLHW